MTILINFFKISNLQKLIPESVLHFGYSLIQQFEQKFLILYSCSFLMLHSRDQNISHVLKLAHKGRMAAFSLLQLVKTLNRWRKTHLFFFREHVVYPQNVPTELFNHQIELLLPVLPLSEQLSLYFVDFVADITKQGCKFGIFLFLVHMYF